MQLNDPKQRRTFFINLAWRKQHAGTDSSSAFLRERTTQVRWPDLTPILSPIRWAAVGTVATRIYMPERMTRDLDIAVEASDVSQARQKL